MAFRRKGAAALAFAAATALLTVPAMAQNWPDRQIKIIAASAPGGGFDLTARLFAEKLGQALGASFIVENRTGAGTRLGTELAAQSAPDGYTFLIGALPNMVHNTGFYKNLRYDPPRDFKVVGIPVMFSYTLVVPNESPFKTFKDLVDFARANPEKLNYGGGKGTGQQVGTAVVAHLAGLKLTAVPYRGAQAVYQDLIAGRIDLYFDNSSTARPLVEAGRVRPLVVSSKKRLPFHPDVPTVRETGIADFDQESWFGLFALAATPQPIIDRMRAEMSKIAKDPEVRAFWEKVGGVPLDMTIEEQEKMIAQDSVRWKKMIIDAGEQQE
jgi:tripartite-type tricarboxylate transporter receptor subunit TctC